MCPAPATPGTSSKPCQHHPGDGWQYYPHTKGCYKFININVTWPEADSDCRSKGGHLASIMDNATNIWLVTHITQKRAWIGAHQNSGGGINSWKWSDGSKWCFVNWLSGEPNDHIETGGDENYVELNHPDQFDTEKGNTLGQWNDEARKRGYICQQGLQKLLIAMYLYLSKNYLLEAS